MKTLICLGGGVESIPFIKKVHSLGHRAIVVDGNEDAPAFHMPDDPNILGVIASCYHGEQAVRALRDLDIAYDGVMCCGVDAPVTAAEIAREFGLPGLPVTMAKLSTDKAAQKTVLMLDKLPIPFFTLIDSADGLADLYDSFCSGVIKPIDSRGGRGVTRILPDAEAYRLARAQSPTGQVMIEQYLSGEQYSTESIIQDGKVLFTAIGKRNYDRLNEFAPYCIEDGFDEVGSSYPLSDLDGLIKNACIALGWDNLTVKGDLVLHNGQWFILELAARLSGGFFATHGHYNAYGVHFLSAAVALALGETVTKPSPSKHGAVSQRYVFPNPSDIGRRVVRINEVDTSVFHTWNIKAGDVIQPVTCHPARWGQALAICNTEEDAKRAAIETVEKMKAAVMLE